MEVISCKRAKLELSDDPWSIIGVGHQLAKLYTLSDTKPNWKTSENTHAAR